MARSRYARSLALFSLSLIATAGLIANACAAPTASPAARSGIAAPIEVAIEMRDDVFDPRSVTVPAGASVTFVLRNTGVNVHNMRVIDGQASGKDLLSETIAGGKSGTLAGSFTTAGSLKFQCDFHLADMLGTLTVQ